MRAVRDNSFDGFRMQPSQKRYGLLGTYKNKDGFSVYWHGSKVHYTKEDAEQRKELLESSPLFDAVTLTVVEL